MKTSIRLPRELWREAYNQGLELQKTIERALEAYLKGKGDAQ